VNGLLFLGLRGVTLLGRLLTFKKAKPRTDGPPSFSLHVLVCKESRPRKTLCTYYRVFVECSDVRAPPEEGAWLESVDGRRHPIRGSCSLGRTPANAIVLDSPKVSRRHALIHLQNIGELWLIDFGSSNGTFFNKRRIHHPIRLSDGDQITIGDQVFKVRQPVALREGILYVRVLQPALHYELEQISKSKSCEN